jgi:hypothetical protein
VGRVGCWTAARWAARTSASHLAGRLVAIGRILGHQSGDDRCEPFGDLGVLIGYRPRRVVADLAQDGDGGFGREGRLPGAGGVQDATEAEEVAAVVDRLAARLFGRHVMGRAGDRSGRGEAGVVAGLGQAEVGDLDPLDAVFEEEVGRFDVAMDEALGVGGRQAGGDLQADAQDGLDVERPVAVELCLERFAHDELHDQIGMAAELVHGVDGDDVVVRDGGGGGGLAEEASARQVVPGEGGGQELDGDDPVEPPVERLVYDAHAGAADRLDHLVGAQKADDARPVARGEEIEGDDVGVGRRDLLGSARRRVPGRAGRGTGRRGAAEGRGTRFRIRRRVARFGLGDGLVRVRSETGLIGAGALGRFHRLLHDGGSVAPQTGSGPGTSRVQLLTSLIQP